MKALPRTYILSPILHKDSYTMDNGIVLFIDKSYENNLRERNPQLGRVEALPDDNWLSLCIGDIVCVYHFTFYGDIGKDRSFTFKDHYEEGGIKYFPVKEEQMFFKYNNRIPEMLPGYLLCNGIAERDILNWNPNTCEFFHTKELEQRGVVTHTDGSFEIGSDVLVLRNSFYSITLDKVEYFRVRRREIVATIENDEAIPTDDNLLVEYLPTEEQSHYKYWKSKGVEIDWRNYKNVDARVIRGGGKKVFGLPWVTDSSGDILMVYINQGVKWKDMWVLTDDDMMIGRYTNKSAIGVMSEV